MTAESQSTASTPDAPFAVATPSSTRFEWLLRQAPIATLIFAQMLPATLVGAAIRPLFAALHGGNESAMHAFMSVNMLGAVAAAPFIGRLGDRHARPRRFVAALAALDAVLLVAVASRLPLAAVLALRTLEGAAHVGAATLLMAEAAAEARRGGDGRTMGLAGGALMIAVALGNGLGGLLLAVDPRLPFWIGAGLAAVVALASSSGPAPARPAAKSPACAGTLSLLREHRSLLLPMSAAFFGRFTIGCLVVTFSLFAHRAHGLSDRAVGGLYTLLTLPFALLTYPAGRLTERVPRAGLLALGAALYAPSLLALTAAPTAALPGLMLLLGVASAMIYAPTLCYAAVLAGPSQRARAMALVNAASCLGMLAGPIAAGITCAVVSSRQSPIAGYRDVFALAASSVVVWLLASARWLAARLRAERRDIAAAITQPCPRERTTEWH